MSDYDLISKFNYYKLIQYKCNHSEFNIYKQINNILETIKIVLKIELNYYIVAFLFCYLLHLQTFTY